MENFGVNISGFIKKQFGLGVAVRSTIKSLEAAGVPYVVNDFNLKVSDFVGNQEFVGVSPHHPYGINIIQINPDMLPYVVENVDREYFTDKYNIGYWAWELEDFPKADHVFKLFNEIWVPSSFCAEAVSQVSPIPVLKFMHAIEPASAILPKEKLSLPADRFIFLTMFDYYSSMERKNPLAVIEAYEKAFGKNHSETLLVIKSSLSREFANDKKKLLDRIDDNASILLIEEIMPEEKLYSYMNCCDCFVSLHRSEGFGLTMAEAMYFGKPVIATEYSANSEFMNVNNSFLVKYDLISTEEHYNFVSGRGFWADADTNDAAEKMKFIFQNQDLAKKIAQKGQEHIEQKLSPEAIGRKMKMRLDFIAKNRYNNSQEKNSKDAYLEFENHKLKAQVTKLKSYKAIKMKIAIKNAINKITGKNRTYDWE